MFLLFGNLIDNVAALDQGALGGPSGGRGAKCSGHYFDELCVAPCLHPLTLTDMSLRHA
jgi:hypothetical protein